MVLPKSLSKQSSFEFADGLPEQPIIYDVFISFRDDDTCNAFSHNLVAAIQRNGLITFRDCIELKAVESNLLHLFKLIEESQISIAVFSKNYATSTWCLEELANIDKGIFVPGHIVLPIFDDVDPFEVRKQSNNYGKVFAEHEEWLGENSKKVQRWRVALTQVANLSG